MSDLVNQEYQATDFMSNQLVSYRSEWLRNLAKISIATILICSFSVELVTSRFGFPGIIPDNNQTKAVVIGSQILVVSLLLFWFFIDLSLRNRGVSQFWVWVPYAVLWLFSAGFFVGFEKIGVSPLIATSMLLLGVAVGPVLGEDPDFSLSIARNVTRTILITALIAAVLFPNRVFSPSELTTGGWFPSLDRLQGLLQHPNSISWIMAIGILLELSFVPNKLNWFVAFLEIFVLILSGSRTASFSLLGGLIAFILAKNWGKLSARLTAGLVVSLFAIGAVFFSLVGLDSGLNGRDTIWEAAIQALLKNPLTGVGPRTVFAANLMYAHNQILQTLLELGVIGFVVLLIHSFSLISIMKKSQFLPFAVALTVAWFVQFVSENKLSIGTHDVMITLTVFQLALYSVGEKKFEKKVL